MIKFRIFGIFHKTFCLNIIKLQCRNNDKTKELNRSKSGLFNPNFSLRYIYKPTYSKYVSMKYRF